MKFSTSLILLSLVALACADAKADAKADPKPAAKADPKPAAKAAAKADADAEPGYLPTQALHLGRGVPLIPSHGGYGGHGLDYAPAVHPVPCYDDAKVIYSTIVEQVS